ncbi:MAG TPA: phosphotransacetylase family protein [Nitrospirota bacterium]|nr:phosphotransacetylase family protein [Nitrospirota bacterium]
MVPVYIGSTMGYSGKSLVTLGLALKMQEDGLGVGYMKPFGRVPMVERGVLTDGDASFMKKVLDLKAPSEKLCPVVYSQDLLADALRGRGKDMMRKVLQAYASVSRGMDVTLIGGARDVHDGSFLGISGLRLIRETGAKVVMVDPFSGEVCVDCLLAVRDMVGDSLVGAVINKVPPEGMEYLRGMVAPFLKKKGIPLLGMLPSDKLLNSITVRQITESLGGTALCCEEKQDELVENLSIGAMDVESALKYFRRTPNKAVITGGHRADIQLAALETSTKCLVLTGDLLPNALIISKAKASGVPVISVKYDTLATVETLEAVLGKVRIREERKVARAMELMRTHFDYGAFYAKAGIRKP